MTIRIGTCSWSDRSLISSGWYPRACRDGEARLKHYAEHFTTVEVDSSFYAIPDVEQIYRWIARTPPGFLFNVKCYGLFSFHSIHRSSLPPEARRQVIGNDENVTWREVPRQVRLDLWSAFARALQPLHGTGRLGYLLFQLPPWIGFSHRMMNYIERMAELTAPFRTAFEVRHHSWTREDCLPLFLKALQSKNIALVITDRSADTFQSNDSRWNTADWGTVIRLHGRGQSVSGRSLSLAERLKYLYNGEELEQWRRHVANFSAKFPDRACHVMFGNCWRDYAVRNATSLSEMLGLVPTGTVAIQGELHLDES